MFKPSESTNPEKPMAVVECKWRNNPASKFDTYTIDQRKLRKLQERGKREGLLALLIVSWEEGFPIGRCRRDRRYLNVTRIDLSQL